MKCWSNIVWNLSHFHDFLCLSTCLKIVFTLFLWQSLYIFCTICWVQKWWTISHVDSYHPKSSLSKATLIPRFWSEIKIILPIPTIYLRNPCMNQPQLAAFFSPASTANTSGSSCCSASLAHIINSLPVYRSGKNPASIVKTSCR
jgi:hypothetical protein